MFSVRSFAVAVAVIATSVYLLHDWFPAIFLGILQAPGYSGTSGAGSILAVLTLVTGSGVALVRSAQAGVKTVINSSNETVNAATLGEDDPLNRFRTRFRELTKSFDRPVLIVIDDLDRCKPKYVVELIWGLLTIFQARGGVFALLGDRNWIESSFAIVHRNMQDASGEEPADFGMRFAEKAIQLSLLLPHGGEQVRLEFVRTILVDTLDEQYLWADEDTGGDFEQYAENVKSRLQSSGNRQELADVYKEEKGKAEKAFQEDPSALENTIWFLNREAALTATRSERNEEEIRHALLDAVYLLPDNPRRIKRLINMIALYQTSAQAFLGTVEGSDEWHKTCSLDHPHVEASRELEGACRKSGPR